MNLDASAIAPQFQWLWIVAGIASLATGGLVVGFSSSARRGLQVAGIQGTLLSLLLLGVAPTALEEQQAVETEIAGYAELLSAEVIELYPETGEAAIREPNLGLISVRLEEDHLRILTGAEAGKVWYHDSLVRETRLAELEGSDTGGH